MKVNLLPFASYPSDAERAAENVRMALQACIDTARAIPESTRMLIESGVTTLRAALARGWDPILSSAALVVEAIRSRDAPLSWVYVTLDRPIQRHNLNPYKPRHPEDPWLNDDLNRLSYPSRAKVEEEARARASRKERIALARALELDIVTMECNDNERRSQALPPRVGLVLALNGGLFASMLGPLSPMEPKFQATVARWPEVPIAWTACVLSSCLAVLFGMIALRVSAFLTVTLPLDFGRHVLNHLLEEPAEAKADKLKIDLMRPSIEHNRRIIARRYILLDCAVRMTQTSILGIAALCLYSSAF